MAGQYFNPYAPQLPQQMNPYMQGYMQQMQMQYPGQQMMQPTIQARYVTGREEAVAAQIPQDGNMCVFADTGHGMIYTKQLNMQDGSAVFRAYRRIDQSDEKTAPAEEYVKKSEFDSVKGALERLRGDFDELLRQLTAPTQTEKGAESK